jgi:hypothetical protein
VCVSVRVSEGSIVGGCDGDAASWTI